MLFFNFAFIGSRLSAIINCGRAFFSFRHFFQQGFAAPDLNVIFGYELRPIINFNYKSVTRTGTRPRTATVIDIFNLLSKQNSEAFFKTPLYINKARPLPEEKATNLRRWKIVFLTMCCTRKSTSIILKNLLRWRRGLKRFARRFIFYSHSIFTWFFAVICDS